MLFEDTVTDRVCVAPPPAAMPLRLTVCWPAFSLIVAFDGVLIVGAMLIWLTVTVNCTLVESTPPVAPPLLSVTVTVIVAVPKLFAAGVKVSVPVEFGLV